jgi:hypothetical protein
MISRARRPDVCHSAGHGIGRAGRPRLPHRPSLAIHLPLRVLAVVFSLHQSAFIKHDPDTRVAMKQGVA